MTEMTPTVTKALKKLTRKATPMADQFKYLAANCNEANPSGLKALHAAVEMYLSMNGVADAHTEAGRVTDLLTVGVQGWGWASEDWIELNIFNR